MEYAKVNDYQLRQMLKSLTGASWLMVASGQDETIPEALAILQDAGKLRLPCESHQLFVIPERFPIAADVLNPRKSLLVRQLQDRSDETGVVVDSLLSGGHALFFATRFQRNSEISRWVECMNEMTTALKVIPIDNEDKLMIAPLRSFVVHQDAS